eukprot:TRINITY_DN70876_c0_g1_i1.p1 TRINITY_DN70876_c0_g1~~TRINITY_DN70876_c0_g1_i1.p1  ORF type:complete len:170 (+),score=47.08 TRINITY_DN70876_c0_g1_i1:40-510(+)
MAGWERHKEDNKYRKEVDVNDNPKHVGEPLRKLTLEDRLELRRQAKEQQRKRAIKAGQEEDSSDDEAMPAAFLPSKRVKSSDSGSTADTDVGGVTIAGTGKSTPVVVDLDDLDAAAGSQNAAAARRARRRANAAASQGTPSPEASPGTEVHVEVLE